MIHGNCPYCGAPFNARNSSVGIQRKCPNCRGHFVLAAPPRPKSNPILAALLAVVAVVVILFAVGSTREKPRDVWPADDGSRQASVTPAPPAERPSAPNEPAALVTRPSTTGPAAVDASWRAAPTVLPIADAEQRLVKARAATTQRLLAKGGEYRVERMLLETHRAALDKARAAQDTGSQMFHIAEWNKGRLKVEQIEAAAYATDPDVLAAQATFAAAKVAPPPQADPAAALAASPAAPQVTAGGRPADADDDGPVGAGGGGGYAGGGGGGSVHVRDYTRKDGTHVQSHTRSAPGSGSRGGKR